MTIQNSSDQSFSVNADGFSLGAGIGTHRTLTLTGGNFNLDLTAIGTNHTIVWNGSAFVSSTSPINYTSGTNTGDQLYVAGFGTAVANGSSVALGAAHANGSIGVSIGYSAFGTADNGIAIGAFSNTNTGIAIGINSIGGNGIAIGPSSNGGDDSGVAIGASTTAGSTSVAIGNSSKATAFAGISIGNGGTASGTNAIGIGLNVRAIHNSAIVLGNGTSTEVGQTIIGYGTNNLSISGSTGTLTALGFSSSGTITGANLSGVHTGASSGTNTGDQTITLSGDATGSGTGSVSVTLGTTGVTPGTYGGTSAIAVMVVDSKGRVTSASTVARGTLAIQNANNVNITGGTITGLGTPSSSSDAATKGYVDSQSQGLNTHASVEVATVGPLSATNYIPGTTGADGGSGVGAYIESTSNISIQGTFDGYSNLIVGDRVLVKNQTTPLENGLYEVSNVGTVGGGGAKWKITRTSDGDNHAVAGDLNAGDFVFVIDGSTQKATGWVNTTEGSIIVGTTSIAWTQFSGSQTLTNGTGLALAGNVMSIGTNGVSNSLFRQSSANSLIGNSGTAAGNVSDIALGATLAMVSGTLQTTAMSGDITTPANSHVTTLGSVNAQVGDYAVVTVGTKGLVTAGKALVASSDVTGTSSGTALTLTIASNAVTYAKIQAATVGSVLLGAAAIGNYGQIVLGSNLSITAGTINAAGLGTSGGTGSVTSVVTGTGLTGGTITNTGTIAIGTSGVTAGTYGSTTQATQITVDALGRITAVTNQAIASGAPSYLASNSVSYAIAAQATGPDSLTFGYNAGAIGTRAISIGIAAASGATGGISLGSAASVGGFATQGISIGASATITGTTGIYGIAIGGTASVTGTGGIAIGGTAKANGTGAIGIGYGVLTGGTAVGTNSIAIGKLAQANSSSGDGGVSIGGEAIADSDRAVAIGTASNAYGTRSVAIGGFAGVYTGATYGIAIGYSAIVNGTSPNGIAIGGIASSSGTNSIAIGTGATASGTGGLSIGANAIAGGTSGNFNIAIGNNAAANSGGGGGAGIAIGNAATVIAGNNSAVAIGNSASVRDSGVALGATAVAGTNAIAIGYGATTTGTSAPATTYSTAIGFGAIASGTNSLVLSSGTLANTASGINSIVLGYGTASGSNQVVINGTTINQAINSRQITQATHAFTVGKVLYYTGAAYALAKADAAATAEVIGVVTTVVDANTFIITTSGYITGLSGLTAGSTYFLSDATAGLLTATAPVTNGSILKPLLTADSTTSGYFYNMRGSVIAAGSPETASTLLGNPNGTAQATQEITLGAGLQFSGTTLAVNRASATFTGTTTIAAQTNTGIMYLNGGVAEENVFSNGNSGVSKAITLDNGNLQSVTITGAVAMTLVAPSHPGKFTLIVTQNATGFVYSISGVKWPAGTAPTYSTAANKIDVISIIYDGVNYYGMGSIAFA